MDGTTDTGSHRLVSGMRPTGRLHLGHYHGTLESWVRLQDEYECFYFVADCHALTTQYNHTENIRQNVIEMVTDWLGAGVEPDLCTIFLQSWVPEHAELYLLLSMIVPLGWLERVPSYKDLKKKIEGSESDTIGLLGYPLLQSADILLYRARHVPVGEDQLAHIELTREIARRFNYLYGLEEDFKEKVESILDRLGSRVREKYLKLHQSYTRQGDHKALQRAQEMINKIRSLPLHERMSLLGYLEGQGRIIFPDPNAIISESPRILGTDGRKMSKSFSNDIKLQDDSDVIWSKIKTMLTDPDRKRRSDKGNPENCPVWSLHKVSSDDETQRWVREGCTTASIGCIDCKKKVTDAIVSFTEQHQNRCRGLNINEAKVRDLIKEGCENARDVARDTLNEATHAIKLFF